MNNMIFVLVLSVLFTSTALADPSMKLRLTNVGFDFITHAVRRIMKDEFSKIVIPDLTIENSIFTSNVTNITFTKLIPPELNTTLVPPHDIEVHSSNGSLDYQGRFDALISVLFTKTSISGNVSGIASGLAIDIQIDALSVNGYPEINISNCQMDIKHFSYSAQSDSTIFDIIFKFFSSSIAEYIRKEISEQFCSKIKDTIVPKLNEALTMVKHHDKVFRDLYIDYAFNQGFVITPDYFQTAVDLELSFGNASCDIKQYGDFCGITNNSDMLYIWISDHIPNCVLKTAYEANFINYTVTKTVCDAMVKRFLRTSCLFDICIGKVFPWMHEHYPDHYAAVNFYAKSAPQLITTTSGVTLDVDLVFDIYVPESLENDTLNETDAHAIISTNIKYQIVPHLKGRRLAWSVTGSKITVHEFGPKIGVLSGLIFHGLIEAIKFITKVMGIFHLEAGFELPIVNNVTFAKKTTLTLLPGAVLLNLDFEYL